MEELRGKTGVLAGLDLPSVGGELNQGSDPHFGAIVWVRRATFKAASETADLWQAKWDENQTVLAAAIPYVPQTGKQVPRKVQLQGAGV